MIDFNSRIVVARYPNGGIGDHISCLAGAWYYAKRTGRVLVIDWRGSRFNPDPTSTKNCFDQLFDAPSSILGVKVYYGDDIADLTFPLPLFPDKWTAKTLAETAHQSHTSEEVDTINALVTSEDDRPEPTVIFNQWIHPAPPNSEMKAFFEALPFASKIRAEADQIWTNLLAGQPGIAIHLRHGNGENIGARAAYWLDPWTLIRQLRLNAKADMHRAGTHGRYADNMPESLIPSVDFKSNQMSFLRKVAAKVRNLRKISNQPNARPILFCDSSLVAKALKSFLPDLVVPPTSFIKLGDGPLHAITIGDDKTMPIAKQITNDMLLELELMRRCSTLVYMDSNFSMISRTLLDQDHIQILRSPLVNRLILKISRLI